MNKPEMEKEIRSLEGKNRDLRNKNADLQTENGDLFNDKIAIQQEIKDLLHTKTELAGEIKGLSAKVAIANAEIKTAKYVIIKERAKLDQEQSHIADAWVEIDNAKNTLANETEKLMERVEDVRKKNAELEKDHTKLSFDRLTLDTKIDEFEKAKKNNLKEVAVFQADQRLLANKHTEASESIAKARELIAKSNDKNAEADRRLELVKSAENNVARIEKELNIKTKDLNSAIDKNKSEIAKIEAKEKSLLKISQALDARESEIQVRSLRVEKIVKEKGIKEELRKLEEELK